VVIMPVTPGEGLQKWLKESGRSLHPPRFALLEMKGFKRRSVSA